jgi:hypothetical protein
MDAEGDAVEAFDHGVVGGDRALQIAVRILAARAHAIERDLIDVGGIARRVDLDVAAASVDELADHPPGDGDHVGHEDVHVAIDGGRVLPVEALRDAVWTQHRHLDGLFRQRAGELVFRQRHVANEPEPLYGFASGDYGRPGRAEILLRARHRRGRHAVHRAVLGRDVKARHR